MTAQFHMLMETEASSTTSELVKHLLKNYFKHYAHAKHVPTVHAKAFTLIHKRSPFIMNGLSNVTPHSFLAKLTIAIALYPFIKSTRIGLIMRFRSIFFGECGLTFFIVVADALKGQPAMNCVCNDSAMKRLTDNHSVYRNSRLMFHYSFCSISAVGIKRLRLTFAIPVVASSSFLFGQTENVNKSNKHSFNDY